MGSCFVGLLEALVSWTGTADDSSVIITASCLCTLVLDLTTEEFLLSSSDFDSKTLEKLSKLIARSLHQGIPDDDIEQSNQKQIILSGYRRWSDRYPRVKNILQQHVSVWFSAYDCRQSLVKREPTPPDTNLKLKYTRAWYSSILRWVLSIHKLAILAHYLHVRCCWCALICLGVCQMPMHSLWVQAIIGYGSSSM